MTMRRWRTWGMAAALVVLLAAHPVLAAGRVALVIANGAYPGAAGQAGTWARLPNAANDGRAITDALTRGGFKVTLLTNGRYPQIQAAVGAFAEAAEGADVAVVYYAGHGFEYGRRNYLVPVDAPAQASKTDLPRLFIDFETVTNAVAKAKVNVFFLDACRTAQGLITVSAAQAAADAAAGGFDDIDVPDDTSLAVIYSTARGRLALDAAPPPADLSPFAWAVAQDIVVPQVELATLFAVIRDDVMTKTRPLGRPQAPYTYQSVGRGFYLTEARAGRPAGAPAPAAIRPLGIGQEVLAVTDEPVLIVRLLRDRSVGEIEALAGQGDPVATYLLGYMYEFGVGVALDLAKARDWLEKAAATGTPAGQLEFGYYLERHPGSPGDQARALDLYEAAARQGYAKAQAHLAVALMAGRLGPVDYGRGLQLLRAAAGGGYAYAMFALAERGDPGQRPRFRAQLEERARNGDADASQWLCELAANAGDYGAALPDCRIAAEAGSATAQARLAIAYHDGLSLAKSEDDSRHWARQALSQTVLREDLRTTLSRYEGPRIDPAGPSQ